VPVSVSVCVKLCKISNHPDPRTTEVIPAEPPVIVFLTPERRGGREGFCAAERTLAREHRSDTPVRRRTDRAADSFILLVSSELVLHAARLTNSFLCSFRYSILQIPGRFDLVLVHLRSQRPNESHTGSRVRENAQYRRPSR